MKPYGLTRKDDHLHHGKFCLQCGIRPINKKTERQKNKNDTIMEITELVDLDNPLREQKYRAGR